jgi:hypothetical protein
MRHDKQAVEQTRSMLARRHNYGVIHAHKRGRPLSARQSMNMSGHHRYAFESVTMTEDDRAIDPCRRAPAAPLEKQNARFNKPRRQEVTQEAA